jgi:transglutaminase-like putative cysteine protease
MKDAILAITRPWRLGGRSVIALVLGVALVVTACGGRQETGGPPPGSQRNPSSVARVLALPSQSEVEKAARSRLEQPGAPSTTLEELRAHAADIAAKTPADRYDLENRARSLPEGMEAAFGFVRDHVRYEAYRGVLRGAEVAYTARAGNAFDRSVLLAELLRAKGISTRFALGALARPEAERLFARIFEPSRPEPDAQTPGLANRVEGQALLARLRARAARDLAAIQTALGPTRPSNASPPLDAVLKEIEEHAWVQALVGDQWVDLDSAFPDALPGRAYTRPDSTVDVLPDAVFQRVTVRVVTEWVTSGSLSEETVLEVTSPAERLLDREIYLLHGPGNTDISGAITKGILAAQGGEPWVPMLWLDGETHVGTPFAFLDQEQSVPRGSPPSGGLRGVFGPGGALGSDRQFVAERLEVEIVYPGGQREVTRRVLVDRAAAAWRGSTTREGGGLRSLERDEKGLIAPRVVHNLWFSAGRHNLAAYVQAVNELFQAVRFGVPPPPSSDLTIGEQLWPVAVQNFAFLVLSDHLVVPSLNDGTDYRFYADSPRLLIVSIGPDLRSGPNGLTITYDLRRDHLRGIAQSAAAAQAVTERRIWFGLLQGALEHDMAEQLVAGERSSTFEVTSTSSLLTGDGMTVLRPGAAPASGALPPDQEAAARVLEALSVGRTVLIPRGVLRGGSWGWWELTPDGELRAVLEGGLMGSRFGGSGSGYGSGKGTHYVDPKTYSATPPKKPGRPGRAAGKQQSGGTDQYVGMIKWVVGTLAVLVVDTALYHTVGIGSNALGSLVSAILSDGSP